MTARHYETATAFRKALEDRLLRLAADEDTDVQRHRRQVSFDRFLCRLSRHSSGNWALKGGYAMELRMKTARTTRDIDLGLKQRPAGNTPAELAADMLSLLQAAAVCDMKDFFVFRVGEATMDLDGAPDIGMRFPITASVADRVFTRFHVDVSVGDISRSAFESVAGRDWLAFAGIPRMEFAAISREVQFAEKLHAYTRPRTDSENSRVKDLVDMILLIDSGELSDAVLTGAIRDTFDNRHTHPIPLTLAPPPPFWNEPFAALAKECGIDPVVAAQFTKCARYFDTLAPVLTERRIPFSKVDCSGNELAYVTEVLKSGWLTTAGKCMEFEKRFAERVGGKYACAVNSATAALHLACEAAGIGPGDKVFVPTMTFTASAEVIRYLGADPVFLDVEYGTCLVTPEILEAAIARHPDAKALMLVHFGGQAAEMGGEGKAESGKQKAEERKRKPDSNAGILDVCRTHGLKVIQDAAHAFPTRHDGRMIGSFPDVTCFSFYANKTITTGEGGMLVTDDEAIYKRAKVMRLHGINRDIWDRFTAKKANWEYDVVAPGFKYNLPDVAAAIGLAQLERADEFRQERQRCAEFYYKGLAGIPCLDLPVCHGPHEDHSWHLFCVVLNEKCPVERNQFIDLLNEAGIGTSVHYKPLHRMTYYRDRYGLKPEDYPNAERHWRGVVTLPVYPGLKNEELAYVCETVRKLLT
jgi:dTDP-4-amino-4,6-dideoxygalactose transaminase